MFIGRIVCYSAALQDEKCSIKVVNVNDALTCIPPFCIVVGL